MSVFQRLQQIIPREAVRAGGFGLAGQAMVSGINFLIMLGLARTLGPASFGIVALLVTVMALIESVQQSLITTPHTVLSAARDDEGYRRYTSAVATIQGGLAALVAGSLLLAAGVALLYDTGIGAILLVLAIASAGSQCQSFWRSVLFTESRYDDVVLNDAVTHGLRLVLVVGLWSTVGVTVERYFLALGLSGFVGTAIGLVQLRGSLSRAHLTLDRAVIAEHWEFGRWLCGSKVVSETPKYVTAAVLTSVLSLGAYGAYQAASQLMRASHVPLRALDNVLRPKLARDARIGPDAVWRTIQPIIVGGIAMFTLLALALITWRETLLGTIYGSEFAPYAAVMFLLAVQPSASLLKQVFSSAFLAFKETRTIFTRSVAGAVAGCTIGTLAVMVFGLPAAGAISLVSTIVSIAWLMVAWRRHVRVCAYA